MFSVKYCYWKMQCFLKKVATLVLTLDTTELDVLPTYICRISFLINSELKISFHVSFRFGSK